MDSVIAHLPVYSLQLSTLPDMKPMQTTLVSDSRTLRALARAGIIEEPSEDLRPKGKKWGRGFCYVEANPTSCVYHKGRRFTIAYRDGCFLPFVYEQHGSEQQ